jgi:hypothetical protein
MDGGGVERPDAHFLQEDELFAASRNMHRGPEETDEQWHARIARVRGPRAGIELTRGSGLDTSAYERIAGSATPWQMRVAASTSDDPACFDPNAVSTKAGADAFYRAHPQCTPPGWVFDSRWPAWAPWAIAGAAVVGGVLVIRAVAK